MGRTIVEIATAWAKQMERRKRDSGETFVCVREDAEEAITDAIRDAHDRGSFFPDDIRYHMAADAIDAIAEMDDDATEDDARERLDEIEAPVYTRDLTAWLASHVERPGIVDEAVEELGDASLDTVARLRLGYLHEQGAASAAILAALVAEAEAEAEEEEAEAE